MGKKWDYDVPSVELWNECYRVLKPGGYLLSFGSSRTYHRMAVKVEDAGFEIRDQIMWVYGSGFPKSHNIGKAVDKINGTQREVIGKNPNHRKSSALYELGFQGGMGNGHITKGFNEWEGFGTALKPAHEPIVMARKPFKGSVAKNVLKWTTGGINIDDCRIEFEETKNPATNPLYRQENDYKMPKKGEESNGVVSFTSSKNKISSLGRFPANIIFDDEAGEILDEQSGITSQGHWSKTKTTGFGKFGNGKTIYNGIGKKDKLKGGASRFFYCPKPSKKEKEEGLTSEPIQIKGRDDGQDNRNVPQKLRKTNRKNTHTTVKPLKLMQYLIRLVTPKGGVTIDPYFGSGSSGKSTIREGNYKFLGIEKEKEYFNIAVERCQFEHEQSLKVAA
jgi:site-specific DNA-methyltransferase (adenine-specific)